MTLLAALDPATPSAEDQVIRAEQHDLMHQVLDALTHREAGILTMRLGVLDDEAPATWADIARTYGTTTARVRRTYDTALTRIRNAATTQGESALHVAATEFVTR